MNLSKQQPLYDHYKPNLCQLALQLQAGGLCWSKGLLSARLYLQQLVHRIKEDARFLLHSVTHTVSIPSINLLKHQDWIALTPVN